MPTAREIMERAGILLNDVEHVRWPLVELADWISEAMRAIVLAKPSALSKTIPITLAAGTLQNVPVAGTPTPLMLVKINRNLITSTPLLAGRSITITNGAMLDAQNPDWHTARGARFRKEVRNYVYDEANPLEFYVYPGNDGTGIVEAVISVSPTPVVATGAVEEIASYETALVLPEPYSVPILDYTLYRAHMKDDLEGSAAASQISYQQFAAAIGLKIQVERATTPNTRRTS